MYGVVMDVKCTVWFKMFQWIQEVWYVANDLPFCGGSVDQWLRVFEGPGRNSI